MKAKRFWRRALSGLLTCALTVGLVQLPARAEAADVYLPQSSLSQEILSGDGFYLATAQAEIHEESGAAHLFRIARGGEATEAAAVRLDILDITAKYGRDYVIRVHGHGDDEVQNAEESRSLLEEIQENPDEILEENYSDGLVSGEDISDQEMEERYQDDVEALAGYLDDAMGQEIAVDVDEAEEVPEANEPGEVAEVPVFDEADDAPEADVADTANEIAEVPATDEADDAPEVPAVDEADEAPEVPVVDVADDAPEADVADTADEIAEVPVTDEGDEAVLEAQKVGGLSLKEARELATGLPSDRQPMDGGEALTQYSQSLLTALSQELNSAYLELEFAPGETEKYVEIVPLDNDLGDGDRTFQADLFALSENAQVSDASGITVTILDDEDHDSPVLSFQSASYVPAGGFVTVTVERQGAVNQMAMAHLTTQAGTAVEGRDYSQVDTSILFPYGITQRRVNIPVRSDYLAEDATFQVRLDDPVNCDLGARTATTVIISPDSESFQMAALDTPETPQGDTDQAVPMVEANVNSIITGPALDLTKAYGTGVSDGGHSQVEGSEWELYAETDIYDSVNAWANWNPGEHYDYSGWQVHWTLSSGSPCYPRTSFEMYDSSSSGWKTFYSTGNDDERWERTSNIFFGMDRSKEIFVNLGRDGSFFGKSPTLRIHSMKPILRPFEVSLMGAEPLYFLNEQGVYVANTDISELRSANDVLLQGASNTGKGTAVKFSGNTITLTTSSTYAYIKGLQLVKNGNVKVIKNDYPVGTTSASFQLTNDFIKQNLDYITFVNNGSNGRKGQITVQPILGYYDSNVTIHSDYRGQTEIIRSQYSPSSSVIDGLPVGLCTIQNANSGKYLANASTDGSGNVTQEDLTNDARTIWNISYFRDGRTCYIMNQSGYYLNVQRMFSDDGINIQTWGYNGSLAQLFYIQPQSDGSYAILTASSGLKSGLDVDSPMWDSGANVYQWKFSGLKSQRWIITPEAPAAGAYRIKNVNSGKYLMNASTTAKGDVTQGSDISDARSLWFVSYNDDGSCTLKNGSGYYLDVSNGSANDGTNIHTWENNGTDAQKFKLIKRPGGCYAIKTAVSNYNSGVNVHYARVTDGAAVNEWSYSDMGNKQWIFEPAADYAGGLHKGDMLRIRQSVNTDYTALYGGSRIRLVSKENSNSKSTDVLRKYDNTSSECLLRDNYSTLDIYPNFDKRDNKVIVRVPTASLSKFDRSQGIFTAPSAVAGEYTEYTVVDSDVFAAGVYYDLTAVTSSQDNVAVWNPIHREEKYSQETFHFRANDELEENIVYLDAQKADGTFYSLSASTYYSDAALDNSSDGQAWLGADGVYVVVDPRHYGMSVEGKLDTIPMAGVAGCRVLYKTVASGLEEYHEVTLTTGKTKHYTDSEGKDLTVYDVGLGNMVVRSYDENAPHASGVAATDVNLNSYENVPIDDQAITYLSAYIDNNGTTYYDTDGVKRTETVKKVDFVIYDGVTHAKKFTITGATSADNGRHWEVAYTFKPSETDKYLPSDRIYLSITTDRYVGNGKAPDEDGVIQDNPALQETTYAPVYTGLTLTSTNLREPVTQDVDFPTDVGNFLTLPLIGSLDATFNIKKVSLSLTELEGGKQRLSVGYIPKSDEENADIADDGNEYGLFDLANKAAGVKNFGEKAGSKSSLGMKSWGLFPIFGLYIDFGVKEVQKYTEHTSKQFVFCGGGLYIGITGSFRLVQYFIIGWFPLYVGAEGELTVLADAGLSVANEDTATKEQLLNTENSFNDGFYADITLQANAVVKAYVGAGLCGTLGARGGLQFDGSYIFKPNVTVTNPGFHANGLFLNVSIRIWIDAVIFAIPIPVVNLVEKRYGYYEDVANSKKDHGSLLSAEETEPQVFMRPRNSGQSQWLPQGGEATPFSTFQEKGSVVLSENGYDRADPQLMDLGDGRILLVFVGDDPARTDEERTAVMYSVYDGSTWTTPQILQDDAAADFEPDLCDAGDKVLISWTSRATGTPYTNETDYLKSLDVYAATMDKATLALSPIERLTDDEFYDSAPVGLYDDQSGDMMVYYLKSEVKGDFADAVMPTKNESVIVYMLYDASEGKWARDYYYPNEVESADAEAELVQDWGGQRFLASPIRDQDFDMNDPPIIDFDAISYNGIGLYTFTVDADNNMDTDADRELFVQAYNFEAHTTYVPIRVTNDALPDARPQLVRNGDYTYLFWLENNKDVRYVNASNLIRYGVNDDGTLRPDGSVVGQDEQGKNIYYELDRDVVFFCNAEGETMEPTFGSYTAFVDQDDNLFITWLQPVSGEDGTEDGQEVFASALIRDPEGTSWSDGVRLTHSGAFNDEVAMLTDADGDLLIVDNQYHMDLTDTDPNHTVTDVKLVATSFETVGSMEVTNATFSDLTPVAGSDVDVELQVRNTGLKSAKGYHIAVYAVENGEVGDTPIYEADRDTLVTPSSSDLVDFTWTMPADYEGIQTLALRALVTENEMDETSQFTSESLLFQPEYQLVSYEVTQREDGFYVDYTIANQGNLSASQADGDTLVVGYNDIYHTGQEIGEFLRAPVGDLAIGEERSYGMPLSIDPAAFSCGSTSAFMEVRDKEDEPVSEAKTFDIFLERPYHIVVNGNENLETVSLRPGQELALSASYAPSDYYLDGDILFAVENSDVARVENGRLVAVAPGATQLEVSVAPYGGYRTIPVVVQDASSSSSRRPSQTSGDDQTTQPEDNVPVWERFSDVAKGSWYEEAVAFAVERGLFQGVGESTFAPNGEMTRAMLMTVLARLDGQDTTGGSTWYEKAMAWAVEAGISDGTDPEGNISREQLVTMLYRYAGSPAADAATGMAGFVDAQDISAWAQTAMRWAVKAGIIQGKNGGRLDPKGPATRAEVATVFQRFLATQSEN